MKRAALAAALAVALAGCGSSSSTGSAGRATLWVTRDRGAEVLLTAEVPAGLTVLQALDREADVQTRYGGRFVQAIEGVQGSLSAQRDWFYFVNGIEGDRSAAEVRLKNGDVEWWDYRSWRGGAMSVPLVVGAYPQPFVRGTTSVTTVGVNPKVARSIAGQVDGVVAAKKPTRNYIVISRSFPPDHVLIKRFRDGALLELGTTVAQRLADDLSCRAGAEAQRRRARR